MQCFNELSGLAARSGTPTWQSSVLEIEIHNYLVTCPKPMYVMVRECILEVTKKTLTNWPGCASINKTGIMLTASCRLIFPYTTQRDYYTFTPRIHGFPTTSFSDTRNLWNAAASFDLRNALRPHSKTHPKLSGYLSPYTTAIQTQHLSFNPMEILPWDGSRDLDHLPIQLEIL
jgi:hypothetical protein